VDLTADIDSIEALTAAAAVSPDEPAGTSPETSAVERSDFGVFRHECG